MRISRAMTGLSAGALLGIALLVPATPASAAGDIVTPPADCTATYVNHYTTSLTCTNRPVDQQWRAYRDCVGAWLDSGVFGNIVTGNGTSTAQCPTRAQAEVYVGFQVV